MPNITSSKVIQFSFRWPVDQTGPNEISLRIPICDGPSPINLEFVKVHNLSDGEINSAELVLLREIAIIK